MSLFKKQLLLLLLNTLLVCCSQHQPVKSQNIDATKQENLKLFLIFFENASPEEQKESIQKIKNNWKEGYSALIIEILYYTSNPVLALDLVDILKDKTGQDFGFDFQTWYFWLWNEQEAKIEDYADFKAEIYKSIDPKFEKYFKGRNEQTLIRLDEVRWGGVVQDGIPPLRNPKMVSAEEANYLKNNNIIFGIEVNGDIRAYPKRILAWHEMFVDEVGETPVAGVYCTLCGAMILYKTTLNDVNHELGTSGFLYRSNKLMYDQKTQSLWNTLQGRPVIGELIHQEIKLEQLSVVTTTWGEWKKRHPETLVLALETGYNRNYDEGFAYKDYFATDELMFNTPFQDNRLKNKQEVLALHLEKFPDEQLAIDTKFLKKNPIYYDKIGDLEFVVLTDKSGANRVYESKGITFQSFDKETSLVDEQGMSWELQETQLISEDGQILQALPYHRSFWFGWLATYPDTRLVK